MIHDYAENASRCSFHPAEVVFGICAPCLAERLFILAEEQDRRWLQRDASKRVFSSCKASSLHKVFASASLLRYGRKSDVTDLDTPTSPDDSFISIKFEKNGQGSWDDRATSPKFSEVNLSYSKQGPNMNTAVVEHCRPRISLRWRKKISHLFQLARWRRSSKGSNGSIATAGKPEAVMRKRRWLRSFSSKRSA